MTKLISSSEQIGLDLADIRANPGALTEVHEDVLRDLMRTPSNGPPSPNAPMPSTRAVGRVFE